MIRHLFAACCLTLLTALTAWAGEPKLALSSVPDTIQVGDTVQLTVAVEGAKDIVSAPFHLWFDRDRLSLEKASEGDLLNRDGARTAFFHTVRGKEGRVVVGLARLGAGSGVSGDGVLALFRFKAESRGEAAFRLSNATLKGGDGKRVTPAAPEYVITVGQDADSAVAEKHPPN